jgi:hypothetical protein
MGESLRLGKIQRVCSDLPRYFVYFTSTWRLAIGFPRIGIHRRDFRESGVNASTSGT